MKKLFTVTDLGPGDGGKGGVVHKVSNLMNAHTIVKVGGAQGSHGVRTSSGSHFAFSQFGCGTFEGVKTFISPRFVMDPVGIVNEVNALQYEAGVSDPFSLLSIDERALCNTPYHGIASRLKEMAHKDTPRGTVGTGVGQAYRNRDSIPELSIFARNLGDSDLKDRIIAVREQKIQELAPIIEGGFLLSDRAEVDREVDLLHDPKFVDWVVDEFRKVHKEASIVDREYFESEVLGADGVVVVESSHGVLTDHYHGFHPHTSALRTLPRFTHGMLEEAGYDGEIVNLGVTRAYQIRHGAGPMVTHDPSMAEHLLPDSNKLENRYQGNVRVGPLDLVSLRYAIDACGGPSSFQGLAITWFDQIQKLGSWKVCNRYVGADDETYFTPSGDMRLRFRTDNDQLTYQEGLCNKIQSCTPDVTTYPLRRGASRDALFDQCASTLNEHLGVPVKLVSFGPTERDKLCK